MIFMVFRSDFCIGTESIWIDEAFMSIEYQDFFYSVCVLLIVVKGNRIMGCVNREVYHSIIKCYFIIGVMYNFVKKKTNNKNLIFYLMILFTHFISNIKSEVRYYR